MPYGVDKEQGGDSKENDTWMETCVKKVMKQGKDKGSAIAICKTTLSKMHNDKAKAEIVLDFMIDKLDTIK
jgi:hypothetical protein